MIAIPTPPPTTSARRAGSGSPLEFRHTFRCADDDCPSRDTALRDWEAGESYRKFLRKYGEADLHEKLRERWYERTSAPNRAVHLLVGNIAAHPRAFMLLGLFYLERSVVAGGIQEGPFPM
ncbi:hypothetical protein ACIPY6_30520 [Streptomyces sp. NPDC090054]|uniref:hypothetical protein n=1 Tax=Streptomyces sp. NPDC090054 TaxID=3365933 RepID=UPI00383029BA